MRFPYHLAAIGSLFLAAPIAMADTAAVTYISPDDFEDTIFSIESAIVEQGLKIEHINHVGDMLERTRKDVGSDKIIFDHADIYNFCSAKVSREVMEADPLNLVHCPYRIFVMQEHGSDQVVVGYPKMPEGEMQQVEKLLETIVRSAIE